MYPGVEGGFFAWGGFFLNETGPDFTPGPGVLHPQVDFLFLVAFAATAATIVSGAVGGFAGLAAAIVLGPRIGRFSPEGKPRVIPGHNLGFATIGVFILLIGWFGFNPGSQLAIAGADNIAAVMLIATNTALAAIAGAVSSMLVTWFLFFYIKSRNSPCL